MHKVFGTKEDVEYLHREGAYLVPIRDGKVGVIRTEKGFFFIGGGVDAGETDEECILRECLEETGCSAQVGRRVCSAESYGKHAQIGYFHPIQTYYLGALCEREQAPAEEDHRLVWMEYSALRGKMHVEMQNWALEQCWGASRELID